MDKIHLPLWVDGFIGWPLVILVAATINLLTACWAHPVVRSVHAEATIRRLGLELTLLSVLSAVAGIIAAIELTETVFVVGALATLFYFIASTMKFTANKLLWFVAGGITAASFLVGEVIIKGNSVIAATLIFCGIIFSLIVGIMVAVANSYHLGDRKP